MEVKDNTIEFYGLKEEIQDAKFKITIFFNKKIKNDFQEYQKQVEVAKNIQWKYELAKNDWKDFSYFLNSFIESSHSAQKPYVKI